MSGWGNFFGKIADYIQGRDERRRNEIEKLEKEYEVLRKKDNTPANVRRMDAVFSRLRVLYTQGKNK